MDGDRSRVSPPTAYYLAHLIAALDEIRARADRPSTLPAPSPDLRAGWGDPAGAADLIGSPAAGWALPMHA